MQDSTGTEMDGLLGMDPNEGMAAPDASVEVRSAQFQNLEATPGVEAERDKKTEVTVDNLLNALSQEIRGAAGAVLQAVQIGPGALRPHLGAPPPSSSSATPGRSSSTPSQPTAGSTASRRTRSPRPWPPESARRTRRP